MDIPPPDPKKNQLRLPTQEELGDLPLFASAPIGATPPGFQLKLPQPKRWKKPTFWILPLLLILTILGFLVAQRQRQDDGLPPADDRLPTIVIDAGHGGHDTGAIGNGLCEKALTLDTALRLERQLRQRGFPVVLTRRDDRFLTLYERPGIANALPHALFVSIHFNDNTTSSGDGVETFYSAQKAASLTVATAVNGGIDAPSAELSDCGQMAQAVQTALVTTLGVTDRGAKPRQLAVVRCARCPAVLVEGGFLNNPMEARKLALPEYREKIAEAVAKGVAAYQTQREQVARAAKMVAR